eukprot:CAMPEP_0113707918 /NCGR_PEP_ID=MMETSP0038_2-20120614/28682_1 /TAXON_ID=2898 /ORGANISM="Cryptomonas paramecium" /LENGTH=139 /DNA_ID=CAMNT_0000633545 /DNA_START=190 /DNA_END=606 /DNA_ORIENTATION=- /assembly_acc=CAM_ASM_000170
MGNGVVSFKSMELISQIRGLGVRFAIITGARTTTLFERVPLLPVVDAYVCETGSRIFYRRHSSSVGTLSPLDLEPDLAWAASLRDVTGDMSARDPPESRQGTLWALYRELGAAGLAVDARGYSGCFRVSCSSPQDQALL